MITVSPFAMAQGPDISPAPTPPPSPHASSTDSGRSTPSLGRPMQAPTSSRQSASIDLSEAVHDSLPVPTRRSLSAEARFIDRRVFFAENAPRLVPSVPRLSEVPPYQASMRRGSGQTDYHVSDRSGSIVFEIHNHSDPRPAPAASAPLSTPESDHPRTRAWLTLCNTVATSLVTAGVSITACLCCHHGADTAAAAGASMGMADPTAHAHAFALPFHM